MENAWLRNSSKNQPLISFLAVVLFFSSSPFLPLPLLNHRGEREKRFSGNKALGIHGWNIYMCVCAVQWYMTSMWSKSVGHLHALRPVACSVYSRSRNVRRDERLSFCICVYIDTRIEGEITRSMMFTYLVDTQTHI